jgi:hypothetical protein
MEDYIERKMGCDNDKRAHPTSANAHLFRAGILGISAARMAANRPETRFKL